MIARLTGIIDSLKPGDTVINVHGVGYSVSIPLSTYTAIASRTETSLYIHTHVREDQIRLFGFYTEAERDLFEILIKVNGVGPSIALSIVSGIEPKKLFDAVASGDSSYLVRIPGIGKSKAEKLVFELTRILKKKGVSVSGTHGDSRITDTVEALLSLGFDEKQSSAAAEKAAALSPDAPLDRVIRDALAIVSGQK